ncbi:MAG: type I-F CRISPR-associated protein Csy1 [Verrucomicrobiales bacterium]|nr:type I-F CRISPR-associated protein Csy1 [Verrucomicrobiales bacterium]
MSSVFHPVIEKFLETRRASKIKADVKPTMTSDEVLQIENKYNEVFCPLNWIPRAAPRAGQISISSHPSKFSHPDAGKNSNGDTTSVISTAVNRVDGYLRTGNIESTTDAIGNAAALDVYDFLNLKINGETIIEHLQQDSDIAKENFSLLPDRSYDEMKELFLAMVNNSAQSITSARLKQVYFPLSSNSSESNEYHLLSLVSNSGLIFDLRSRLDEMHFSDRTKELRTLRKDDKYSPDSYTEVFGSVTIGYGGTKPQNISVKNSKNGGRAYLLASMPPELEERAINFPTADFFSQCIPFWQMRNFIKSLHSYYKDKRNNMNVRAKYDEIIQSLIDNVVLPKLFQLRQVAPEQYNEANSNLPEHQRIWITTSSDERLQNHDWLISLAKEMASWIQATYRKVIGEEKFILMGEAEFSDLVEKIESEIEHLR